MHMIMQMMMMHGLTEELESRFVQSVLAAGRNNTGKHFLFQWGRSSLLLSAFLCPCSVLWSGWEGFSMIAVTFVHHRQ